MYPNLLGELVAEFTLTDNPANSTTSQLYSCVCQWNNHCNTVTGMYPNLLGELVAEFTLTDNPANSTTSQLYSCVCQWNNHCNTVTGMYPNLLGELVAEFTLTDNPANSTTSQLYSCVCQWNNHCNTVTGMYPNLLGELVAEFTLTDNPANSTTSQLYSCVCQWNNHCNTVTGMYPNLLRELVAEFTLTDNPANTTTFQLYSCVCQWNNHCNTVTGMYPNLLGELVAEFTLTDNPANTTTFQLYSCVCQWNNHCNTVTGMYPNLLGELVAEFTLTDNPANTTTSQVYSCVCQWNNHCNTVTGMYPNLLGELVAEFTLTDNPANTTTSQVYSCVCQWNNHCNTVTGMYPNLLRELVAEFTLTDNPANTTTFQLYSCVCQWNNHCNTVTGMYPNLLGELVAEFTLTDNPANTTTFQLYSCVCQWNNHCNTVTGMYPNLLGELVAEFTLTDNPANTTTFQLYSCVCQWNNHCNTVTGMYPNLLRELVAEFTLTDNPANTTTSQLRSMCHVDDSVILGSWLQETDHKAIEDQLQPNSASGSGALEHDAQSLYLRRPASDPIPGPLPLGVAVIDSSVKLYGVIFPRVAHKHRYQMLQHFIECIRQAKSSRQQAVQMNIFTAVLCALKSLSETKTSVGNDEVKKAAFTLIMDALGSANPILRCAAGEALGRLAQVVGDSKFIAETAQYSFDKLKSARDVVSRTGHSLALGCLHRYVGGMGSGQHLNTSVSILLALAQDFNSPVVQVWSLHALALIADSGGPMFRSYVEPTLSLVLQLLLTVPPATVDVHQCLGKCLSALITSIGPELQSNTGAIATARLSCLVCCAIMQDHPDSLVQAEAIACLQQLHMFAPRHVNLNTLVPHLCDILTSSHLLLRRAAVACLRQLVTREAKEVSAMALTLAGEGKDGRSSSNITESGLEGALFSMLDTETDGKLTSDVQDTLVSLLQALAIPNLTRWLQLLKDVLSASTESSVIEPDLGGDDDDDDDEEGGDDIAQFNAAQADVTHPTIQPRWPTKVFAVESLMKIMTACEGGDGQYDLARAKELKHNPDTKGSFLVLHLSDLIRMSFIAATSDSNQLRLAGMSALEEIISGFAEVPEPEFPGCVILEQYQAQVGAALRPAFAPDTSSDVTAAACEVCSKWIGSGVARDLNDLRRVHQLLVSSLAKLNTGKARTQLYNESASTMEKLAVIRAWAEVYIVAIHREKESQVATLCVKKDNEDYDAYEHSGESLLSLVQPELANLSSHWFHALKDHALLSLPPEFWSQLPQEGGAFYHPDTMDTARGHYKRCWPPILYALAIWLNEKGFAQLSGGGEETSPEGNKPALGSLTLQPANALANMKPEDVNKDRLHLILGICMESLCSTTAVLTEDTVIQCLKALYVLLDSGWPRRKLGEDPVLCKELLNVMHRVILTKESVESHQHAVSVVKQVVRAAKEIINSHRAMAKDKGVTSPATTESSTDSMDTTDSSAPDAALGEGGTTGDFQMERSVVFATLEVCLCGLVRHLPALNPAAPSTGFQVPTNLSRLSDTTFALLSSVVLLMPDLMHLCSPMGGVTILPTILHLTTSVARELAARSAEMKAPTVISACLQTLKLLCTHDMMKEETVASDWLRLLQSAVATLLHYGKPGEHGAGIDQGVLVQMVTVFIVSCPRETTGAANLQEPVLDCFREAWDSNSVEVRLKCVQSFVSILQHPDRQVAPPFIHGLAPRMMEHLHAAATSTTPPGDQGMRLLLEEVAMMETLVALAEDNKRVTMVAVFVPILVSMLLDENTVTSASTARRALNDTALNKLLRLGQQYPDHFKQVMAASGHLRPRLAAAVKLNQAAQEQAKARSAAKAAAPVKKPTIQLSMDFSKKYSS
ncbi:hypothetical protein V1264_019636 [Littorina saxatilis]|uniref:HEAT repeat-containing protein 5B n=1 Tax=Littorina saxatilis TaxID=31220 RepID=A0AAN9BF33_9CAEN